MDDLLEGDIVDSDGWRFDVRNIEDVYLGSAADQVRGNQFSNVISTGGGADRLDGGGGVDTLIGGNGDDTYVWDALSVFDETGTDGFDTIESAISADISSNRFRGTFEALTLLGTGNISGIGNGDDNVITGNSGSNTLSGNGGNDTLIGGAGADNLRGGAGDDTYRIDALDTLNELIAGSGGIDTVEAAFTFNLATSAQLFGDFENLTLLGASSIDGRGNALNNTILGNGGSNDLYGENGDDILEGNGGHDLLVGGNGHDRLFGGDGVDRLLGGVGNDWLDGGAGADALRGGAGNDTYVADAGDTIDESIAGSGGIDTVVADFTFSLSGNPNVLGQVENIRLTGDANVDATGNALDNQINGNAGSNTLRGLAGNDVFGGEGGGDILIGGIGNDTYYVNSDDLILEAAGEGTDRLIFFYGTNSYVLGAGVSVEVLEMDTSAVATARNLTGNEFAQTLRGNDFGNTLDGGAGADIMEGFGGADLYIVDHANDRVIEAAGGGFDFVQTSISYTLGADVSIELFSTMNNAGTAAINLTGNALFQGIVGNAGANILDGRGGGDEMSGLLGDDWYYVRDASDRVLEKLNEGTDRVLAAVSYALEAGQHIELLTTAASTATTAINLTGNELTQTITGNAGANILNSGGGGDMMYGLAGDDVYHVNANDIIVEGANKGYDSLLAHQSYVLAAGVHLERMIVHNPAGVFARNLTGNEFAQELIGGAGENLLDGGGGADVMRGQGGNDTYVVDNAGDRVIERASEGVSDQVYASVSWTLTDASHVELIAALDSLSTAAMNLTGNEFAQTIIGNNGSNVLNGRGGADVMYGYLGDDDYYVDHAGDQVMEAVGGGANDRVFTSVSYTLGAGQEIERLATTSQGGTAAINLIGNEHAQTLIGNAGANVLNGMGGADTMFGYGGNDDYVVDDAGDVIGSESVGNGAMDRVYTSVSYTLAAGQHIERLSTTDQAGVAAINLTGSDIAQLIVGNAGNNIINGRGGADTMFGYGGDDTYYVDNANDMIGSESAANGANDQLFTSVTYILAPGQHIERIATTSSAGTTAINLVGSNSGQTIVGNAGANIIRGMGGNDTLIGAAGNDRLMGGTGNDILNGGSGNDTFIFDAALNAVTNVDTIQDYNVSQDSIWLDDAVFTGLTLGALAASAFTTGAAATTANHRIIYNAANGALSFDADGNGGGAAIQFASLAAGLAMNAGEFTVI